MAAMNDRERHLYIAKLSEQAQRYDEMIEAMKNLARMDIELTAEERSLLTAAYQKEVGSRRTSRRILAVLQLKEEAKGNEFVARMIRGYMARIEEEITRICNDILSIIAIHLLPSSVAGEAIVYFYKMKGDYYRYLAEIKTGNEQKEAANQAQMAYQAATSTAMTDLPPTHPTRLGLALNFAVLYYEILNSPDRACQLAKHAFDDGMKEIEIDNPDVKPSKDTTHIMQLLDENLELWTADLPEGDHYKAGSIDIKV